MADDAHTSETAWRLQERQNRPLRPSKPQDGTADLPLFQTDLEEFTSKREGK